MGDNLIQLVDFFNKKKEIQKADLEEFSKYFFYELNTGITCAELKKTLKKAHKKLFDLKETKRYFDQTSSGKTVSTIDGYLTFICGRKFGGKIWSCSFEDFVDFLENSKLNYTSMRAEVEKFALRNFEAEDIFPKVDQILRLYKNLSKKEKEMFLNEIKEKN